MLALIRIFQEKGQDDDARGTIQYLFITDRKSNEHLILHSEFHIVLKDLATSIRANNKEKSLSQLLADIPITKSDIIYLDGFRYFYSTLNELVEEKGVDYIIKIKDSLLDTRYIRIKADNEADAYTVFEILNARGSNLEDYELLKNYIMRYILPKEKVDEVKIKWLEIERNLGNSMKTFFRHYVTHIVGSGSSEVYRTLQKKFPKDRVDNLLNDLYKKASLYKIIISPEKSHNSEEFEILSYLKSSGSTQLRPLILSLLSAYYSKRINESEYLESLRFIRNFFVCFTIISSEKSNKLTDVIEKYAPIIEATPNEEILHRFLASMKRKLPTLETFKRIFSELGYSNHYEYYKDNTKKKQVLAALKLIEAYLSPGFSSNDVTIEHILPDCNSKESATIGNLTLLEKKLNGRCKDKSLEEKISIYDDSNFRMTRNVNKRYKDNLESFNIGRRAQFMAEMIYNDILKLISPE